jgi:hypothetical protein
VINFRSRHIGARAGRGFFVSDVPGVPGNAHIPCGHCAMNRRSSTAFLFSSAAIFLEVIASITLYSAFPLISSRGPSAFSLLSRYAPGDEETLYSAGFQLESRQGKTCWIVQTPP